MLKQTTKVLEYELPIKITSQKGGGFVVTCPTWSACYAQGETVDEAVLEIILTSLPILFPLASSLAK